MAPPPERIELRGLRALVRCGATRAERERRQPAEADLDVVVDLSVAGRTDDLADTVDYAAVCAAAEGALSSVSAHLLEHLATAVGDTVLAGDARVIEVTVALRKLRPPVPQDLATAGVRITRTRPRRRAFLAMGSNLGDRRAHLRAAVDALTEVVAVSPLYETEPVGGPTDQGPYLNAVVELASARSPRELLRVAQELEQAAGRVETARWGPRTLDIDVLLVGDLMVSEPDLEVPHPRMWQRRFVLAPLADLAPDLVPTMRLEASQGAVRRVGTLGRG